MAALWNGGVAQHAGQSVCVCPVFLGRRSTRSAASPLVSSRQSVAAGAEKRKSSIGPMLRPPGPASIYPEHEGKTPIDYMTDEEVMELHDAIIKQDEELRKQAEASMETQGIVEPPPEWNRPDEGNPNMPRRPPEYQPPQTAPRRGPSTPEFDPPGRSRPAPPDPSNPPMRPLPPDEKPKIPPNERDPLRKAPEQMPGPSRRSDEETQPRPGEASAHVQEEEQDNAGEEAGPVLSEEDLQYVMTEEHMQPGGIGDFVHPDAIKEKLETFFDGMTDAEREHSMIWQMWGGNEFGTMEPEDLQRLSEHIAVEATESGVLLKPRTATGSVIDDPEFKAEAEALDWEGMDFGDELEAQVAAVHKTALYDASVQHEANLATKRILSEYADAVEAEDLMQEIAEAAEKKLATGEGPEDSEELDREVPLDSDDESEPAEEGSEAEAAARAQRRQQWEQARQMAVAAQAFRAEQRAQAQARAQGEEATEEQQEQREEPEGQGLPQMDDEDDLKGHGLPNWNQMNDEEREDWLEDFVSATMKEEGMVSGSDEEGGDAERQQEGGRTVSKAAEQQQEDGGDDLDWQFRGSGEQYPISFVDNPPTEAELEEAEAAMEQELEEVGFKGYDEADVWPERPEDSARQLKEDMELVNELWDEKGEGEQLSQEDLVSTYVVWCNNNFHWPGLIEVHQGYGGLPMVRLTHPKGDAVEVYMQGATITSWKRRNGRELLHLRDYNPFDNSDSIQGGIQIAFPTFNKSRELPQHGFMDKMQWSLADSSIGPKSAEDPAPHVTFVTRSNEQTMKLWPHQFEASYSVQLMQPDDQKDPRPPNPLPEKSGSKSFTTNTGFVIDQSNKSTLGKEDTDADEVMQLLIELRISNDGEEPFSFTTALRPHFACDDLSQRPEFVRILGLGGKWTYDYENPYHPKLGMEGDDYVYFAGKRIDKLWVDAHTSDVKFCPGDATHMELLLRHGFEDVGAFNQGLLYEKDAEFANFVVLATGRVARKITLLPGEMWTGQVAYRSHTKYWAQPDFDFDDLDDEEAESLEPAHDRMFDDIGPQMRPMQPRKHSQKEEEDRQNKARKETEKQQQLTIERNKRRMN